ncbi:hypothetical protein BH09VER1_BH09VER1_15340 [soil metagenome]
MKLTAHRPTLQTQAITSSTMGMLRVTTMPFGFYWFMIESPADS